MGVICALICDKRLISCFRRCDIFINMPHSKNTQSNRFSSNYHRKLCCLYRNRKSPVLFCLRCISSKYPRKFLDSICGPFRDKVMRMYDVANAGRSGTALCVLPQKKPHSKNTQSNRFSSKIPRKLGRRLRICEIEGYIVVENVCWRYFGLIF